MTEKSVSKVSRVINCLIVALLVFAMCMILGLNRVKRKIIFFPVSDGYRWECQEFDMNFECKKLDSRTKIFCGEAVINGTLYEIGDDRVHTCTKTKGRMELSVVYSGVAHEFLRFKYKIKGDKMICEVQTDEYGIAPENGILTFVKVPINSGE